jgi:hypothetical protein
MEPSTLKLRREAIWGPWLYFGKAIALGKAIFDQPYCITIAAKKDNFEEEWGQCLSELVTAQRINQTPELVTYGVVSNGETWDGNLKLDRFTKNIRIYSIQYLDQLFAAVNCNFDQCRLQIKQASAVTPV